LGHNLKGSTLTRRHTEKLQKIHLLAAPYLDIQDGPSMCPWYAGDHQQHYIMS